MRHKSTQTEQSLSTMYENEWLTYMKLKVIIRGITVACSRLRDNWVYEIEKART